MGKNVRIIYSHSLPSYNTITTTASQFTYCWTKIKNKKNENLYRAQCRIVCAYRCQDYTIFKPKSEYIHVVK